MRSGRILAASPPQHLFRRVYSWTGPSWDEFVTENHAVMMYNPMLEEPPHSGRTPAAGHDNHQREGGHILLTMTFDELKEKHMPCAEAGRVYHAGRQERGHLRGKAKALKNRVSQYFANLASHTEKTRAMVSQIDHFDVIVADSEFEALILENSLIKRHQPTTTSCSRTTRATPTSA